MKKRGFTLIELLAVIIILAIVALVATPIILNVVNDAKKSAGLSEAKMIYSGINNYCEEAKLKEQLNGTESICKDGVSIEEVSQMVNLGNAKVTNVKYENGKVTELTVESNGYEVKLQDGVMVIVDSEKIIPTIVPKYESAIAYEGQNIETSNYLTATFGSNGGSITCNPSSTKDLAVGKYTITCKAIGNNGKESDEIKITLTINPPTIATSLLENYDEKNTTGLLKDNNGYYFNGKTAEVNNNFVWFAGHLWRVISIDNDNNLTMITQQPITSILIANEVWKTEQEYKNSYVNSWLNDVFLNSISDDDKLKILDTKFNIGGTYNSTTNIVENIGSIQTIQKVGLLDENQYTKAGLADSYLDIKDVFWLGSRYNDSKIRIISNPGNLQSHEMDSSVGIRPVIRISNMSFTKGEGTISNPYRIDSTTTSTTNIKVGEYILLSTSGNECGTDKKCLFRVVSKDNDSVKVILNGVLKTAVAFDLNNNGTYTRDNTIDKKLRSFASTIDSSYRYTGNKSFNIGTYGNNTDYRTLSETVYTGNDEEPVNIGLPVIGEMFSGNDIDLTQDSKVFVNVSTIENPYVGYGFWTMNPISSQTVRRVSYYGKILHDAASGGGIWARPVMFLNQGLTFTGGDGTAENPFTLE